MTDLMIPDVDIKEQAFRRFYSKHSKRIFEKAMDYTGDRELALSVVRGVFQEVYARVDALTKEEFYELMLDAAMEVHLRNVLMPEMMVFQAADFTQASTPAPERLKPGVAGYIQQKQSAPEPRQQPRIVQGGEARPQQGDQPMQQRPRPQQGDQPMQQRTRPQQGEQAMQQRPRPQQGEQPMQQRPRPQQGEQAMQQRPRPQQGGQPMQQRPRPQQGGQPMQQRPRPQQGGQTIQQESKPSLLERIKQRLPSRGAKQNVQPKQNARQGEEAVLESSNVGRIVSIVLVSTLIALVVWCIVGLLMDMGILPEVDLGYTWFNNNIFPIF